MASLEGCGDCGVWKAFGFLCAGKFGRYVGMGIIERYDSQYVRQFIDTSSATLGADVLSMVNMTNTDGQFIYMLPFIKGTVEPTRSEENFATDDANENYSLETGLKVSFVWQFFNQPAALADRLEGIKCKDFDVFLITVDGTIVGSEYVDGDHSKMYGWAVNKDSFIPSFVPATAGATPMVRLVFDLESVLERNSTYAVITPAQLGYNPVSTFKPAKYTGAVATVVDTTHLKVVLRAPSMSSGQYTYARGLTVPNGGVWKVYNVDTNVTTTLLTGAVAFTDVPADSVAVGNEPSYTLTITAAPGDNLQVLFSAPFYQAPASNTVLGV